MGRVTGVSDRFVFKMRAIECLEIKVSVERSLGYDPFGQIRVSNMEFAKRYSITIARFYFL
jgi:hypothetical protein